MPGKNIYENIRTAGGISFEYMDLIESDFAAASGAAYVPPEDGDYRRINVARAIQLLSSCPVVVETFQTSAGEVRVPASTASETTDDAGDGRFFVIKNSGTAGDIVVKDYLGTTIVTLMPQMGTMILGNSINNWDYWMLYRLMIDPALFDTPPSDNYVLAYDTASGLWKAKAPSASAVAIPYIFSKDGICSVGTYLRTGSVVTNKTGQYIKGTLYIKELKASISANATSTTRIQFVRRTAVSTFTDIAGAFVDITAGSYQGTNTPLSIAIGPDWEVGCYNKSGATINDVVAMMFTSL